jgi:hypothetical protein
LSDHSFLLATLAALELEGAMEERQRFRPVQIFLMAKNPTTDMTAQEMATIESAIFSKRVRRMLGWSLDTWNSIMLLSLTVAGVAAAVVVVSTYATIELAKKEAADQKKELDAYKLTVEGKVAEAEKEGIEAGKTAGNALLRTAELEKQPAELKAANLALEAKITPRRLTGEASRSMSERLSAKSGSGIAIVSRLNDPEASDLGDDLASAFNNARWQTGRYRNWLHLEKGVLIATLEGTTLPSELEALIANALDDASIAHKTITIPNGEVDQMSPPFQEGVLYLLVGVKP